MVRIDQEHCDMVASDILCPYHGRYWSVLTLQGFTTVWTKSGTALMRLI